MKKYLFILAAAALGFASCSNDDVVSENQSLADANTISFRPLIDGATRAATASNVTSLNSFYVTAFKTTNPYGTAYINDVQYTNNGSGTYYKDGTSAATNKYANEYYWPTSGTLDFYAYNKPTNGVSAQTYHTYTLTPATSDNSTYDDVVYATLQGCGKDDAPSGTHYGTNGVPLNFRHTASKIMVNFKNTSANLKFDVEGWQVGYLDPVGNFTLNETTTAGQDANQLAIGDWDTGTNTKSIATKYTSTFSSTTVNANTSTGTDLGGIVGSFILVPQRVTAATAYTGHTAAPADGISTGEDLNGSYIAVKLKIKDSTSGETIADDGSGNAIWVVWPIGDNGSETFNWLPGKQYTYTIDLAGGGYYPKNNGLINPDENTLDPILSGAVIKFVNVTVDSWSDASDVNVTMP